MKRSELQNTFINEDIASRRAFINAAMTHVEGRQFLWWLLQVGKAINFQPFAPNALNTAFACGEMQVGNQILTEVIEAGVENLPILMTESLNRDKLRNEQLSKAKEDEDG